MCEYIEKDFLSSDHQRDQTVNLSLKTAQNAKTEVLKPLLCEIKQVLCCTFLSVLLGTFMDNPSLVLFFSTHGTRFAPRKLFKCFKTSLKGIIKVNFSILQFLQHS